MGSAQKSLQTHWKSLRATARLTSFWPAGQRIWVTSYPMVAPRINRAIVMNPMVSEMFDGDTADGDGQGGRCDHTHEKEAWAGSGGYCLSAGQCARGRRSIQ